MDTLADRTQSMTMGVVIRRQPGVTRWASHAWKAVAVLPGAGSGDWRELRREGEIVDFAVAGVPLTLHAAECEAYHHGLMARAPAIYIILRQTGQKDQPLAVLQITASPYEAQDYADSAEEIVEKVPMPHGLEAWVRDFVDTHFEAEEFIKRKRNKHRTDLSEDGKGDARISQMSDVYRAPGATRRKVVVQ